MPTKTTPKSAISNRLSPSPHAMLVAALWILAGAGCGGPKQEPKTLTIDQVPAQLMAIAREKLPGVRFDTAWQKPSGTFEIRGKAKNGKIREIEVRPDGTIEEIE